ncbi:MAG: 50S ribosomal protein L4 [Deltaproteobacteria bacterium]|nr:50S ribosomal protein L4 [Deltaproteobacteria bacterium]
MPSLPLYNMSKQKVGSIELNDAIFAAEVRPHLMQESVRAFMAHHYQWKTANSLTRTEVQGSRKKLYRQKGTGQARHGDKKAPIFVGGGKAHGPKPRLIRHKINKQVARGALISALSMNQKEDRLFVIDRLELDKYSTKNVAGCMKAFGCTRALFVTLDGDKPEKFFSRSTVNLEGAKCVRPEALNVFDLLKYKNVILSQKAVEKITERLIHA